MRNKKDSVFAIVIVIILVILVGLLVWNHIKYTLVKEEFKNFMKFQIELTQFVIEEECDMNYNETINKFLKYKSNEILNNVSSTTKEIDNE